MITKIDQGMLTLAHEIYRMCKQELAWANKGQGVSTRGEAMGHLNRARADLKRIMNDTAWKLWPKTGRPRKILWRVVSRAGRDFAKISGSYGNWKECNDFIESRNMDMMWEVKEWI